MRSQFPIRLLEKNNNERGDLFTRLASDLFLSLGYEDPRLDVNKGGYELDVKANHALDGSLVVAECKATEDRPGGPQLNKFAGVLQVEQFANQGQRRVDGYFVSLFGFKGNAVEVEEKITPRRFTLLDGPGVVDRLVNGQRLCQPVVATEQAGRCIGKAETLKLDANLEVVAHERGLFWAVCYKRGAIRTAVVLVAADGTPALRPLAEEILVTDKDCNGELHKLTCHNPGLTLGEFTGAQLDGARTAWRRYLEHECGFIQVEGVSADEHVATKRFTLESLFVPQRVLVPQKGGEPKHSSIAKALLKHTHLAILAAPGGGKSTLLKRLAVAYADPARRSLSEDGLPDKDWFPIFLRCRDLRDMARRPFGDILEALAKKEHLAGHAEAFVALAQDALKQGKALLLVDGLDEISDDSARTALVCTLRAALDAWPACKLILTSREAGFRHVAPHLAPFCNQVTLSPLQPEDITTLSERWHVQVEGDTAEVCQRAKVLAERINGNDRVKQLATNPLLLTILFLVKRQTGDLPTGRAKLYGEAVKVLLWSWNVEGFNRMDPDDSIPRLAWVAHGMMLAGVQRISRPKLHLALHAANEVLENTFGLRHLDPGEFIDRVEYRSSLLMMTGKDVEEGQIQDFYEFRHLTFQEYLAAVACVKGWNAGRPEEATLASVLEPCLLNGKWREVIPLAAVLGEGQTGALLARLIELTHDPDDAKAELPYQILMQCLADDAPAAPKLIEQAMPCILRFAVNMETQPWAEQLFKGRHGVTVIRLAASQIDSEDHFYMAMYVLKADIAKRLRSGQLGAIEDGALQRALSMMDGKEPLEGAISEQQTRLEGCLVAMGCAFLMKTLRPIDRAKTRLASSLLDRCGDRLLTILFTDNPVEQVAAAWALWWIGECDGIPTRLREWIGTVGVTPLPANHDLIGRLGEICLRREPWGVQRYFVLAIAAFPLAPQGVGVFAPHLSGSFANLIKSGTWEFIAVRVADLIVNWYKNAPLSREELADTAQALLHEPNGLQNHAHLRKRVKELLELLQKKGGKGVARRKKKR